MRKLLTIPVILVLLLFLLSLALMRSERSLLFIAHWAVENYTDLRLELRSPVLRPLRGRVSAGEIHLYPKAADGPPFLSVLDLSGEVSAAEIYSGTLEQSDLNARQVIIYVSDRDQTSDPAPIEWLRYLRWLPRNLDIDRVHIVSVSDDTLILRLNKLHGERRPGERFYSRAEAQLDGDPQRVELDLAAIREEKNFVGLGLEANLVTPDSGSAVRLNGELRATREDILYDFQLDGEYSDIGEFLASFDVEQRLRGTLSVKAHMRGDADGFVLSDGAFVLDNMPEYGIEAAGSLEYHRENGSSIRLQSAGELRSMETLVDWLGVDLRPLGRAQASATLTGSLENPVLERFILRSENADGLAVNIGGSLAGRAAREDYNRVNVDIQGPELAVLEHWTGPLPHEPGPFSISGVLAGRRENVRIENVIIEVGSSERALLRVEGSARALTPLEDQGLGALRDARLKLYLSSPDSRYLAPYLPTPPPEGFAVNGLVTAEGSGDDLQITGGEIEALSSDISLTARPRAGRIHLERERPLAGLLADLSLQLSDSSALSQFVAYPVPVLGAVNGQATLSQRQQSFALEQIRLQLDNEKVSLSSQGGMADIATPASLRLQTRFSGLAPAAFSQLNIEDLGYPGTLSPLAGQFELAGTASGWDLRNIRLQTEDQDGPLRLALSGVIRDLGARPAGELALSYQLRDPELLDALTGFRMNPVSGELAIRSHDGSLQGEGFAWVGETRLNLATQIYHDGESLEKLSLRLHSPKVQLDDLGLQAAVQEGTAYKPVERLDELDPVRRLERRLRQAPRFETDITLDLEGIVGENTNIHSLNLHFTGAQRRYTLRRFSLTYDESPAELRAVIDLNAEPPFASLAGEALALPMNTLSKDLGMEFDISGLADVRGGLTARGHTGAQLLDSLDGSLALALEDAVIQGAAYDVLATDLLAWFYSGALLEKSTRVDCTMAQFLLEQGVARSDSLYIETRKMVATGRAKLDLAGQIMDVKLTPRSKSRAIQVPDSVRLRGKFDNPKVTVSPVAAAFDAYAEFISLAPRMALRIFGLKHGRKRLRPCLATP